MYVILPKNGFPSFFTFSILKIFLANILTKTLKHISKDAEFSEEFRSIFEIPAELFLEKYFHHFSFFGSSQLHDWVGGHLFNFSTTRKSYLKNKDGSFVEQKILYRMSLKQSLQCVENYPKNRTTFWLIYYAPPVISMFIVQILGFFISLFFAFFLGVKYATITTCEKNK
jgi:hypothetical protein